MRISGSLPPSLVDRLQRLRQRNATVGHVLDRVAARLRAGSAETVREVLAARGFRIEELDDGGGLDNPHLAAYPPA